MTDHRHDWSTARTRIQERMEELRLNATDLIRASGLSDKHVRTLLNGTDVAVPRDSTRWALCDALGWSPDSIDRILEGEEPVIAEPNDVSGEVSLLGDLAGRLEEIEAVASMGLLQLENQQKEMEKFYRLHTQLAGEVRASEDDLRSRLAALESALEGLRRGRRQDGADAT